MNGAAEHSKELDVAPSVNVTLLLVHFASPERPAELVVVHVRLALPLPPQPGKPLRVPDDELAPFPFPTDGPAFATPQQLQQEVPQLDLAGAGRPGWFVGPVREQHCWRDTRTAFHGAEEVGACVLLMRC